MQKPTILVIEHHEAQWLLMVASLRHQFPDVDPILLSNPVDAILHLEACLPQAGKLPKLILLDLQLPIIDVGLSMLQIIKTHHIYRQIPTIVLGQSSDANDILETYKLRSNSYIVKPDSYEKWLEFVAGLRHYWWTIATLPKIT